MRSFKPMNRFQTDSRRMARAAEALRRAPVAPALALAVAMSQVHAQNVVCWGSDIDGQSNVTASLGTVRAIAGAGMHSMALQVDGTVRCWGSDSEGQSTVPADVGPALAIAGGAYHSIALLTDGTVRCWGSNVEGQSDVPADLGPAMAISGGAYHTSALLTDGAVRCWGLNSYGQCTVPVDLGPATAIAGVGYHTIALRTDGKVRCWGNNFFGQCSVPTDLAPARAIAAGWLHSIALLSDGTVRCWGSNAHGECNVPADLGPATAISGGWYHTLVLRTDGTVRCWGRNSDGQCNAPSDLGPSMAIAGGGYHTLALKTVQSQFTLSLTSASTSVSAGSTFVVRASSTSPPASMSGAQLTVRFDASRLRLDAVAPVGTSPMGAELAEQIDNTAGTLRYALGLDNIAVPLMTEADLCDLSFTVLPGSSLCGVQDLVNFGDVGPFTTRFTRSGDAAIVVPELINLPSVNLDDQPPVLLGVPASNIAVAADAGSIIGAYVELPTVTAADNCDGAVAVTVAGVPAGSVFPIGTTTVTWSSTDLAGNTATASIDVTVGNYQLLDATITLKGFGILPMSRAVRVAAGGQASVIAVALTELVPEPGSAQTGAVRGVAAGLHVPVVAALGCVAAKDPTHSVTGVSPSSVAGVRWTSAHTLHQGDSDGDDLVDIVDYGLWLTDFNTLQGAQVARDARSNFNGDLVVTTADFGYVAVNFFRVGESCAPGAEAPRVPRDRVRVKELRRRGLGDVVSADLNRDGWVDMRDIQMHMQGGGSAGLGD